MKLEDIIEGLNKHIEIERRNKGIKTTGHLVLQKEIVPNSSFKVYKTFKYILWFTKNKKSHRVITIQHTAKSIEGYEEILLREMNIMLSTNLFNWIGSNSYRMVINGEYNGISENKNE